MSHTGAIAVVDATGQLVASYGDPYRVSYLRSSAKPFQALPLIEAGGQEKYALSEREIALICASHSGTDEHVALVSGLQARLGVQESHLLCGAHAITHQPTVEAMRLRGEKPTPNRNNCSGKHTGMLAYARMKGLPLEPSEQTPPYIDPAHPIQQDILRTFCEMCAVAPEDVQVAIDGCSAPTFAIPLFNAALGYARLCDPASLPAGRAAACAAITSAMTGSPEMVGGPDSFDTHLMRAGVGRLVCKVGAEGLPGRGPAAGRAGAQFARPGHRLQGQRR